MPEDTRIEEYERVVLPHLDAAYNLARWLTGDERDAEDVVQEACLRAFRFLDGFHGGDARAWLLAIVRHACYSWLQKNRAYDYTPIDDALEIAEPGAGPEEVLLQNADEQALRKAIAELPVEFREALVLRELEGLSYKEIAGIAGVPLGTVMSRLARGRKRLQQCLTGLAAEEA